MPVNTAPIFVLTPNVGFARIAAANTARDGSGSNVTLCTAGANGTRVDYIEAWSAQATAAASGLKVLRFYLSDAAGANPRLIREVLLPALTPSTTVIGPTVTVTFTNGLLMKSGQILYVTQSVYAGVADQTDVRAQAADY